MDDRPRNMISVAAELVGMHPQTLRLVNRSTFAPSAASADEELQKAPCENPHEGAFA